MENNTRNLDAPKDNHLMYKGISVIICTYNGAKRLPDTIKHLALQSAVSKINFEIIVVDNASTDTSASIATEEWNKYNISGVSLRIIYQSKPGKIHALEKGIEEAKFEYVIICDDDNWLATEYLEKVYAVLDNDPKIGAVGGTGIPVAETGDIPDWFYEFEEGYACGKQGFSSSDVSLRGHLWGAGLGTRKLHYQQMYKNFPSFLTGRHGDQLTAGEDAEYCQRLILKGYTLYYSEELLFHHFMPNARLSLAYKEKLFAGFNESNKVLNKYYLCNQIINKCKKNKLERPRLLITSFFRMLFARSLQDRKKQMDIFVFLFPFSIKPDSIISKIKKFHAANT